jgi:hypothetical protein
LHRALVKFPLHQRQVQLRTSKLDKSGYDLKTDFFLLAQMTENPFLVQNMLNLFGTKSTDFHEHRILKNCHLRIFGVKIWPTPNNSLKSPKICQLLPFIWPPWWLPRLSSLFVRNCRCPCLKCTIKIIQSGVKRVVYHLSYKV